MATSRFRDLKVWRERRFALGLDEATGGYFLSIPVAARLVDYEERYALDPATFARFMGDEEAAAAFADRCRRGEMNHRRLG